MINFPENVKNVKYVDQYNGRKLVKRKYSLSFVTHRVCIGWNNSKSYFEIYKTKQQQEFLLKQQAQQGTTALEIQKAKTQNIYFTAVALIAGAVIIGAFK